MLFSQKSTMAVTALFTMSLVDIAAPRSTYPTSMIYSIIDRLVVDLLVSISQESFLSGMQLLLVCGQILCVYNSTTPDEYFGQVNLFEVKFLYANGSILVPSFINCTLPATLNASVTNYLQVLFAASLVDNGIWCKNSIFYSSDAMNASI